QDVALAGYALAALFLFFLSGYAAYRVRRFLLTRTLWRGIRFSQGGSAFAYALRRLFLVALTFVSLGLAYPFQVLFLWRYRYANTWYGDRKCTFGGRWRDIAPVFHFHQFAWLAFLVALFYLIGSLPDSPGASAMERMQNDPRIFWVGGGGLLYFVFSLAHIRATIASRFLSRLRLGQASVQVRVPTLALFAQYVVHGLLFVVLGAIFLLVFGLVAASLPGGAIKNPQADLSRILQLGWTGMGALGLTYLAWLAFLAMAGELVLRFGFWKLVVKGMRISGARDLETVRARGEESALAGQGLADALNVGAY
ncbi:MAG TPA: DUF898 family protein, partial [Devosia sp.]|nr:DUF898 family protein [Devosia sp.]